MNANDRGFLIFLGVIAVGGMIVRLIELLMRTEK